MMERIAPLSKTRHRDLKVQLDKVDAISAETRMVPLVTGEFLKAAVQYPILFTKNAATGQFVCVALTGFEDGENLFWREERWDAIYVPINVARQPFFLGAPDGATASDDDFVLCVDTESPCLSSQSGEALFDAAGAETAYLRRMQGLLADLVRGERQTAAFIAALLAAEILTDVALDIQFANGDKCRVQGFYTIDEKKLDALDDAALCALRAQGYLPLIYAMVISVAQIFALIERRNAASAKARQWFSAGAGQ